MSVPVGTPYHRLARTERHRWWRPVVGTLLVLVLYAIGAFAIAVAVGLLGLTVPDGILLVAIVLLSNAVLIPVVLLAARWVQRRPVGSVSSVVGRLRWRWLLVCAGLAGLAIVVAVIVGVVSVAVAGESGQ